MASKGRPYRSVVIDGFEVLIGKGARENDELSLKIAEPTDLWLHVGGGTPGSHVVVRNPTNSLIPRTIIEKAASLAAWYSKARNASKVKVDYCSAKDVSKPRGAPPGQVTIKRFRSITVVPESEVCGDL